MRLPIRTRLTLVFVVTSTIVLAVAGVTLMLAFRAELRDTVDEGLRIRFAEMAADPRVAVETLPPGDEVFAAYVSPDTVVRNEGMPLSMLSPSVVRGLGAERFVDRDIVTAEERVPVRFLVGRLGDDAVLVVGVDVEDQREAVSRLTAILVIGGPILLAALSFLGWVLAGAALRPVERLRSEADALQASEPSRRLAVPETGDELQRLAETLNEMLDRVHDALDRERRLVDEASHELRTPVGVLQAEVDLALKEPRSREELEAALRSIAQETERLRRLTQDLLVLARSDRGRLPVHRADVDVASIVHEVATSFSERARQEGVEIRVVASEVDAHVDGDRVRQAVSNLVDNALRHTERGGSIEVRADRKGERVRIAVVDRGHGFEPEILGRAFEPFARADGDRAGDGAGLGLTIVRAVAEAHGGSATARNLEDGGASVELDLPV